MKRLLSVILAVTLILSSLCLSACVSHGKNRFFKGKAVKDCGIEDLPQLEKARNLYAPNNHELDFDISVEDFDAYAKTLYEYLLEKNFSYLGYRGIILDSFFGGCPEYEFFLSSELSDHVASEVRDENGSLIKKRYIFVFSNNLSEDSHLLEQCTVNLTYNLEYEKHNANLSVYYPLNQINSYKLIPSSND